MKRLFILILIFGTVISQSKAQGFQWAKQFDGEGNSTSYTLVQSPSGELYVAGSFEGTIDFDAGEETFFLTSYGDRDVYVTKMDASGNFLWAKQIGGTEIDYSRRIALDPSGNLYVTGSFKGTADMDPGEEVYNLTSVGGYDMYVTQLDEDGNFMWAGQMGGSLDDNCTDIKIPPSGDIYIAGYFLGIADFDPNNTGEYYLTASNQAVFVEKLSSDHTLLWAGTMGGPGFDYCQSMCLDEDENICTTGMFMGPADFDPGETVFMLDSDGDRDVFISKLNSDGEFVWAKQMGGPLLEAGQGIDADDNGNLYLSGNFQGTVDFSTNETPFILTSFGDYDIFSGKLDADGNLLWMKQMGGLNNQSSYAMAIDNSGNSYVTGLFEGTADFNPGEEIYEMTSFGDYDIFVTKLDVSGNFVWAADIGGTELDRGLSIISDDQENIYTSGYFTGTADFDPSDNNYNLTANGDYSTFVLKLDTDILGIDSKAVNVAVKLFPNPVNQGFQIDFENILSEVRVVIFNTYGQQIYNKQHFGENKITIELNGSNGLYFVKFISKDAKFDVLKIIKQ